MNALALISNSKCCLSLETHFGRTADEFSRDILDEIFGTNSWVCCNEDDLPTDFSCATYTIENGELVKASDEVMTARAAAKIAEQNATIRETRRRLYDDPNGECAPLYWNWVESQKEEDFDQWVASKNKVREQNPYDLPLEGVENLSK